MSVHTPYFRPREEYRPGMHAGVYANLARVSERRQLVQAAEAALGCDRATAERMAFLTWLVEMRWVSDDPSLPPVRVQSPRPHGLEAWYEGPGQLVEITR